ncbi:hypothetical protein RX398_02615 [Collinsella aerofaciens]|uniref:hypothetical protein n=1 Tax=Collinsella aerofaciens TaxID=74426 RepID=UPI002912E4BB|nr:hypothetical protein [Collinsella aerofaciens]MDU8576289.1 hypothetical protein [Collinsella aerofaciens]
MRVELSWIEKLGISDARGFHFGVQNEEDALLFEVLDLPLSRGDGLSALGVCHHRRPVANLHGSFHQFVLALPRRPFVGSWRNCLQLFPYFDKGK